MKCVYDTNTFFYSVPSPTLTPCKSTADFNFPHFHIFAFSHFRIFAFSHFHIFAFSHFRHQHFPEPEN